MKASQKSSIKGLSRKQLKKLQLEFEDWLEAMADEGKTHKWMTKEQLMRAAIRRDCAINWNDESYGLCGDYDRNWHRPDL